MLTTNKICNCHIIYPNFFFFSIQRLAHQLIDPLADVVGDVKRIGKSVVLSSLPLNSLYIIDLMIYPSVAASFLRLLSIKIWLQICSITHKIKKLNLSLYQPILSSNLSLLTKPSFACPSTVRGLSYLSPKCINKQRGVCWRVTFWDNLHVMGISH